MPIYVKDNFSWHWPDGVLNSDYSERKDGPRVCQYTGIESSLVKKLKKIVEATNARIVLVSSWKDAYKSYLDHKRGININMDYTFDDDTVGKYLYNKLSKEHLHIIDTTFNYERTPYDRGMGITKYLEMASSMYTSGIESFVILDDEIFDDYKKYNLLDYLVKTNPHIGLSDEDVEKAIKILNEAKH